MKILVNLWSVHQCQPKKGAKLNYLLPLRVSDVEVRRKGRRLLGPICLAIEGTGITIILGPNGSGKTSLLRLLHGLERPRGGKVEWNVPEAKAQSAQSFVFQTPILMRRSVLDCVAYPLTLRGMSRSAAREAAEVAVNDAGLGKVKDLAAPMISGGEKQKLALVRALITNPEVLFLDEPCASLDGRATGDIENSLRAAALSGVRILMSTHDLGQARRLADEVLFLVGGRLVERADAKRFFGEPQTGEAQAFLDGRILV